MDFSWRSSNFCCIIFILCLAIPLVEPRNVTNTSKAGLAWPNGNWDNIDQFASSKVSWYYTWSVWPVRSRQELEFVPMLWGKSSVEDFTSNIDAIFRRAQPQITEVLGMNEPEQPGQSNMTAQEGATLWKTYLEPLRSRGLRLGSPAPAGGPSGKVWLQDFIKACNGGCNFDFLVIHWYNTDADAFISFLHEYHTTFNKPIWITEWACQNMDPKTASKQCSDGDVRRFMNQTQRFMDNATFIERYAWFGAMRNLQGVNPANGFLDSRGRINCLGKQYVGAENCSSIASSVTKALSLTIWKILSVPIILLVCLC